ncbi:MULTISPECIES: amino acid ABC transporter permease [Delftia]|uniref:Amino acid ABC transporter permease n=2 Tax=Delftia TaxID=80865 RepID=A0AAX3SMW1_9BURK|nr:MULTISPECIES: amino acid ABC transporter permease [Delftia]EPD37841.1 polar amino acid transport system permease [Delftia acidovorans CCUG 274B]EPD43017.1 polar amino acid transport system permease [Delftia acidovorans CCUG 15835]KAF1043258.1 MAG: L-cystine transport system permease protein YecS [Delftia tsuruhatensis]MBS3721329.1 L-cystine transport system permease protein YecS [Delftia sp. PE138]MDC2860035.1 amino acid ABC transporter permease [Delftia sp. DT-2]
MIADIPLLPILAKLAEGLLATLALSLLAFVLGGATGLLVLFARVGRSLNLRRLAKAYIQAFQNTPLLMQMFIVFFGSSMAGLDISPWTAAAIGLTLYTSAYLAEVWRGCVEAIPRGQWEASSSLAMGYLQQMRHVVLPQALRLSIAPTVGFSVQIIKGTAVASIIGFSELTKLGSMLANATFQPFLIYGLVAAGYFLLCWPLSLYASHLEKKLYAAR